MDLSIFGTQVVQTGKNGSLSGSSSALFGNGGLGSLGNLNFLEAILGNLDSEGEIKSDVSNENLKTNENVKKETVDLALLQLALLGQDVDKNLEEKLADLKIEEIAQTTNNRIDQLTKLINHLTSGLPQEVGNDASIEDLVSRLNNRLEKLGASLEAFRNNDFSNEDAPFKLLIATGLNPAQLTNITNRIEEVEAKLGRELTVEDLIAGVGNIIPAPGDDDHEFSSTDALQMILDHSKESAEETENITQEEHAEIRAEKEAFVLDNSTLPFASPNIGTHQGNSTGIVKNFDTQAILNLIASNKIAPAGTPTNGLAPTNSDTTVLPEDGISSLPQSLSNAEFRELFGSKNNGAIGIQNTAAKLVTQNITPEASIPKVAFLGDMMIPANWNESLLSQSILSDVLGFDIQTGTPLTTTMQAAHIATASQSAGQSHPATATVAAQITKAAQNGDTGNITLQLDPPELGRVEVRMEFGAENTVKAHLIVEKPETLLMLQRDMAALERALQDAGMETGSDALNYEMADEDYGFGGNKRGGDQTGTDSAKNNLDEDEEIILTTMNWDVDPETGHVHYNIIA